MTRTLSIPHRDPVVDAVSDALASVMSRRTGQRWVGEPNRAPRVALGSQAPDSGPAIAGSGVAA
jgi:hypothetical protein